MSFNDEMSVSEWFVTLLLVSIPVVNIILLLVWAFSSGTNINKQNFAKATLLWMIVPIGFIILLGGCGALFRF